MEHQKNIGKVHISQHSGIFTLEVEQILPITLFEAWNFFSRPENLAEITPSEMGFKITSGKPGQMYAGQIISYKINIIPGIKSSWVTEITQVKNLEYFIDEQRFGPYKMWHHEHRFTELESGILMHDKVSYKIPFGLIGRMVHALFIKRKLIGIFSYRINKLDAIFASGKMKIV
jgi:ligand-binding SRPBCC domain-containing protein